MKQGITLQDLRSHLFDVIERLKEGNDPAADPKDAIDIDRAMAISKVAREIIDIAKVEVDAVRILASADNPEATKHMLKAHVMALETTEHSPLQTSAAKQ